jgi:hypothetical protein
VKPKNRRARVGGKSTRPGHADGAEFRENAILGRLAVGRCRGRRRRRPGALRRARGLAGRRLDARAFGAGGHLRDPPRGFATLRRSRRGENSRARIPDSCSPERATPRSSPPAGLRLAMLPLFPRPGDVGEYLLSPSNVGAVVLGALALFVAFNLGWCVPAVRDEPTAEATRDDPPRAHFARRPTTNARLASTSGSLPRASVVRVGSRALFPPLPAPLTSPPPRARASLFLLSGSSVECSAPPSARRRRITSSAR